MKYWLLIFSACSLLIWSCNDTIPVGSEILPGSDGQGNFFSDTATLYTTTVREDSLRSDKLLLSQLGYTNDPVFGTTKSSLLMSFIEPSPITSFSILDTIGGYQLDSVILALKLNGIYGDSTKPMSFTVYKLTEDRFANSIPYYSNMDYQVSMIPVGRIENYIPRLSDNYEEDSINTDLGPQLRINLSSFFGQSLINALQTNGLSENAINSELKGLLVVPDEQDGSILELDMSIRSSNTATLSALKSSRIQLYYKNANAENLNVIILSTVINVGISKFEHNYASTNVETALNSTSPTGDAINYIQGLAGVKTKIEFPYLAAYGNIAIQKAVLVITRSADGFEDTYSPPDRLFALKVSEDGTNENISDFIRFSDAHIGGFSEQTTLENGQEVLRYRLNISDYIQDVISGNEPNNGMFITLYGAQDLNLITLNNSDLIPDRIVIGGGSNSLNSFRLKLELTFTNLE